MTTSKTSVFQYRLLQQLSKLLGLANISAGSFFLPSLSALMASICEAISVALLIPVVNGIIRREHQDFSNIYFLGEYINDFLSRYASHHALLMLGFILLIFIFSLFKIVLNYWSNLQVIHISTIFSERIRALLFKRFLSFGKLFYDNTNSGAHQQTLVFHVASVSHLIITVQQLLYGSCTLVLYGIMLCNISWKLTLVVALIFPVSHYSMQFVIKKIERSAQDHAQLIARLGSRISETLLCMPLVKATANESFEFQRFEQINKNAEAMSYSVSKKQGLVPAIQEILSLCLILILVCVVGYLVKIEGPESIAAYVVYIVVLRRASVLIGVFTNFAAYLASLSGAFQQFDTILEENDEYQITSGKEEYPGIKNKLEFRSLTFQFPNGTTAIKDFDLTINKGQTIALVGHSGAGKSTVMNLLLRFYDCPEQSIFIDDKDLRNFSIEAWANKLAQVFQDNVLFDNSIKDNILYACNQLVSDQQLNQVIKDAALEDLVSGLPQGLETVVGERGVQLSGGERQRVAIARAMLRDADLLLLDEATSALDSETENLVQAALDKLMQGRTTIVIAHRLATIKNADQVVVLENGQIVEQGTPQELLNSKGAFHRFWEQQQLGD